jgi:nucleoid DNA-binding protein
MSKIATALSKKLDLPREQVELVIDGLGAYVIESLQTGEEVRLPELGTFGFKDVPERMVRVPRTNDQLLKVPERLPKFKISVGLKAQIQPVSFEVEPSASPAAIAPDVPVPVIPSEPVVSKSIVGFVPPGGVYRPAPDVAPLPTSPAAVLGFVPPGQHITIPRPVPVPVAVTPPPVPVVPDELYYLPSGSRATKAEILAMNAPDMTIWHHTFGPQWRLVRHAFPMPA